MGEKHLYCGKSMGINFPDFPHTMVFFAFSHTVGNLWGNPCISHMMKYTIGWESDGKYAPILWGKYEYQFSRLSPYHGFCCIFPYCEKFMGKPIHFPYAEVYHRMGIGWEKSTHTMGKVWLSISQTFPIPWVLLHFLVLWEIYGENPYISHMMTLVNFFLWLLCFRLMIRSETSSIVKKCGAKIRGQTVASKCLMCLLFFREINSMTMDKTSVRENHHAHVINLMLFKLIIFIRFKLSV